MTTEIKEEINRVEQNIAESYAASAEQGAELPGVQDSDHLADTIRHITNVRSFNGRTGAVYPAEGDYTPGMIHAAPDIHNHEVADIGGLESAIAGLIAPVEQNLQNQINDVRDSIPVGGGSASAYHAYFEPENWNNGELRLSQEVHGLTPSEDCMCLVRSRVDRNACEYNSGTVAQGRADIAACVKAALDANTATPDTYPVNESGVPMLTWYQVQYFLLEDILTTDEEARAKATELQFDWKDDPAITDNNGKTLEGLLDAAYIPGLGGAMTTLNNYCDEWTLPALGLRRYCGNGTKGNPYDRYGKLVTNTWCAIETVASWEASTGDLVLKSTYSYAGDLCAIGG